jgi:hypothetical protein
MKFQAAKGKGVSLIVLFLLKSYSICLAHPTLISPPLAILGTYTASTEEANKASPQPGKQAKKRTPRISSFKKQQSGELLRYSLQMGLGFGIIGSVGYMIGGKAAISAAAFMGPLISGLLVKPLGNIGSQLCILFTPYLADPGIRRALNFKKQYEARKHKLTKSMQEFLYMTTERYTNLIQVWGYQDKESERAIEEVLAFPISPKPIDPPLEPVINLLKDYPEEVRVHVGDFASSTIIDSKAERLTKKTVPCMFVGAPGTGKTYLAYQLGNLLGVPVEVIDVTKYEHIDGSFFMSSNAERGLMVDVLLSGKTRKGNFSNKIIVLDEIDKALMRDDSGKFIHPSGPSLLSLLHTLLETQETTIRLGRYGGATYDISQLKIILIANHTFSELLGAQGTQALESRVNLIKFKGFESNQKSILAQKYIQKICADRGMDYATIDQQVIDAIVEKDNQKGNKGIRVMLKIIDQYLRMLQRGALIGKIASMPTLHFDVQKAYEREQSPILQDSTTLETNIPGAVKK